MKDKLNDELTNSNKSDLEIELDDKKVYIHKIIKIALGFVALGLPIAFDGYMKDYYLEFAIGSSLSVIALDLGIYADLLMREYNEIKKGLEQINYMSGSK